MKCRPATFPSLALAMLLPLGALSAEPEPQAKPGESTEQAKKVEKGCKVSSSSRIRRDSEDCSKDSLPTRRYSREDIESTGQMDTGEALRRLDPRLH